MTSCCKMTECIKPILISTIAAFVALFGVEYLVHGVWLKPIYEQTASMWRPKEEMGMFPWCFIRLLVLSFLISALYCKCKKAKATSESCDVEGKKQCPVQHAMCFGVILGLLMGTWMASSYLWMPIPGELAVDWFIGGFVEGMVVSLAISCTYCNKNTKCTMKDAKMKDENKA